MPGDLPEPPRPGTSLRDGGVSGPSQPPAPARHVIDVATHGDTGTCLCRPRKPLRPGHVRGQGRQTVMVGKQEQERTSAMDTRHGITLTPDT
jgi:hypothetical protein